MLTSGRVVFTDMEEVHYGKPAAQSVAEVVKAHGAERVFLMVSGTLNRQTDEVESVRRALGNKCVGTFDKMPAHSPRSAVIAAAAQAREAKADLIVTLGGGSITDGAKAVQLCLANDITTVEGLDKIRNADVKAPTVRQVSIPTTLSAGEFSGIAGVTNEATKVKELFRHPLTIPQAVILDPEVTRHTPMWLFLSTGIRAVDHCVEGVCSNESTEFTNASALHGLVDAGARPAQGEGRSHRHEAPGSTARSARGCRWAGWRPACRWVRATASATCWARCSTCRTATPPASCCPR